MQQMTHKKIFLLIVFVFSANILAAKESCGFSSDIKSKAVVAVFMEYIREKNPPWKTTFLIEDGELLKDLRKLKLSSRIALLSSDEANSENRNYTFSVHILDCSEVNQLRRVSVLLFYAELSSQEYAVTLERSGLDWKIKSVRLSAIG